MEKLTSKDIEGVLKFWNDNIITKYDQIPEPLSFAELKKRLGISTRNDQISDKSLLNMARAVLSLPPETEDLPLIEASYYFLVQQHAPWAISKNKRKK